MRSLRVLLITRDVPYPLLDGYQLFTYHVLREMEAHCLFDLVSFSAELDRLNLDRLRPYVNSMTLLPPNPSSGWALWKRRFRSRLSSLPSNVFWTMNAQMAQCIQEKIAANPYDLVYLNSPELAWYAPFVSAHCPTVIAPLDARCRQLPELVKTTRNPVFRLIAYEQALKSRRYEARYYAFADACIVVSSRDRQALLKVAPTLRVWVIPLGIDTHDFAPRSHLSPQYDLVFSGNLAYPPNHDAALVLVTEIMPILRAQSPSLRLGLIGANPQKELLAAAAGDPGIVVTGFVEDLVAHITQAKVFVCPVRYGTGMRVKIFEAMAAGLPIVTYAVNVEELAVKHGEHLMIAKNVEQLVSYTRQLLENENLRTSLGKKAHAFVLLNYSWQQIASQLIDVFNNACEAGMNRLQRVKNS